MQEDYTFIISIATDKEIVMRIILMSFVALLAFTGTLKAQCEGECPVPKGTVVRPAMHSDMASALNSQFKLEMESAYLYLGMSTYFAEKNLKGFSHWFYLHAQEELTHAMKVYNFLLDRGVPVAVPDLHAPMTKWDSPIHVLETALSHEILVSQAVKGEYALALELQEYDACEFVLWFLKEQVEEEELFEMVLNRLYMIDGEPLSALLILDIELGKRQP